MVLANDIDERRLMVTSCFSLRPVSLCLDCSSRALGRAGSGKSKLTGCEAVLAHCDRCDRFLRTFCVVICVKCRREVDERVDGDVQMVMSRRRPLQKCLAVTRSRQEGLCSVSRSLLSLASSAEPITGTLSNHADHVPSFAVFRHMPSTQWPQRSLVSGS
jgi:hypothetical protein